MRLREIRRSKNITQQQLADLVGVDNSVIAKYEKGTIVPPSDKLNALAKILEVSVDYLIGNTSHPQNESFNNESIPPINDYVSLMSQCERTPDQIVFHNHSALRKQIIAISGGHCELCGAPAPFIGKDGLPYLEIHFVKWLAYGGAPTIDNAVVLCPNCKCRITNLLDTEDIKKIQKIAKSHNFDTI